MTDQFCLFTSMRFDLDLKNVPNLGLNYAGWNYTNASPFYMLDYHRDRLLRAATHWNWQPAVDALTGEAGLELLAKRAHDFAGDQSTPVRLRIVVTENGEFTFQKFDTPIVPTNYLLPSRLPDPEFGPATDTEPSWSAKFILLVDDVNSVRSEYTHFKTTRRAMYDSARQRAGILAGELKEVLIISHDAGTIMEGSITTPYFWRAGKWVTPPVSTKFSMIDGSGGQDGTSRRYALERGLAIEQVVKIDTLVNGEKCWISNGVSGFIPSILQIGQ